VILSQLDDDITSGIVNAGSSRLIDRGSGAQISSVVGSTINDTASGFFDRLVTAPADGSYHLSGASMWDNDGQGNSGLVRLITP
jgi:hypothetical protein